MDLVQKPEDSSARALTNCKFYETGLQEEVQNLFIFEGRLLIASRTKILSLALESVDSELEISELFECENDLDSIGIIKKSKFNQNYKSICFLYNPQDKRRRMMCRLDLLTLNIYATKIGPEVIEFEMDNLDADLMWLIEPERIYSVKLKFFSAQSDTISNRLNRESNSLQVLVEGKGKVGLFKFNHNRSQFFILEHKNIKKYAMEGHELLQVFSGHNYQIVQIEYFEKANLLIR